MTRMRSRLALPTIVLAASAVGACRRQSPAVSDSTATSGTPSAVSDSTATSGTPSAMSAPAATSTASPAVTPSARSDSTATSGTPRAAGTKRDSMRRADSAPRPTKRP
jgi:hypothetical protein